MNATNYSDICDTAEAGIYAAAQTLEISVADIRGYYLAGGDWDAETSEQLAELLVECWREQDETI